MAKVFVPDSPDEMFGKRFNRFKNLFQRFSKGGPVLVLLIIFITLFVSTCLTYVGPYEYGIKQVNLGLNKGIHKKVYLTGLHFLAPFGIHTMHRFPKNTQVVELTDYPGEKPFRRRVEKSAHIQTSDGFYVDVDVSILYRITDPYKVITTVGPGRLYEDNGILPKVEPKLKEALGTMTTEEFFNSPLRAERALVARGLLNTELGAKGIEVQHVLVRYFKYSPEIQKNIEEKKLRDQLVFTNQAKGRASNQQALVKKMAEEGEASLKVLMEGGNAYVVKKNAERDLYVRTQRAEADLLVKLAEAQKTELINDAYRNEGSDKLVGLRMAEVYKGLDVIVLPSSGEGGINPLDLNQTLGLFGVNENKGGGQ
ncbi:MAG: SPFH domain-containing protein [Candidatus Omnitrophica bacterium]|nr:SPFH domain-containing protein [Candidatus Omnitrophota bacterium]